MGPDKSVMVLKVMMEMMMGVAKSLKILTISDNNGKVYKESEIAIELNSNLYPQIGADYGVTGNRKWVLPQKIDFKVG